MHVIAKMKDQFMGRAIHWPWGKSRDQGAVSPRQIELVQSTWKLVEPIAEQAATLFYNKLFELDPNLKPLFHTEMGEQGKKLMQMMATAVKGLDNLDAIIPAVQQLGKRHVGYGVETHHYDTVAIALLWTLEQGLGEAFTDDVAQAWSAVYNVLSNTMKNAAAETAASCAVVSSAL